jgi:hypothetical protein
MTMATFSIVGGRAVAAVSGWSRISVVVVAS